MPMDSMTSSTAIGTSFSSPPVFAMRRFTASQMCSLAERPSYRLGTCVLMPMPRRAISTLGSPPMALSLKRISPPLGWY